MNTFRNTPAPVLTEVGPTVRRMLLDANRGDELRAALVVAWLEIDLLHLKLKGSVPAAEHRREIANLQDAIARFQRRHRSQVS